MLIPAYLPVAVKRSTADKVAAGTAAGTVLAAGGSAASPVISPTDEKVTTKPIGENLN